MCFFVQTNNAKESTDVNMQCCTVRAPWPQHVLKRTKRRTISRKRPPQSGYNPPLVLCNPGKSRCSQVQSVEARRIKIRGSFPLFRCYSIGTLAKARDTFRKKELKYWNMFEDRNCYFSHSGTKFQKKKFLIMFQNLIFFRGHVKVWPSC